MKNIFCIFGYHTLYIIVNLWNYFKERARARTHIYMLLTCPLIFCWLYMLYQNKKDGWKCDCDCFLFKLIFLLLKFIFNTSMSKQLKNINLKRKGWTKNMSNLNYKYVLIGHKKMTIHGYDHLYFYYSQMSPSFIHN